MKKAFVLFMLNLCFGLIQAQELKRQASLGASLEPQSQGGFKIQSLSPKGSAEQIGLAIGDQIISLNQQIITDYPSLFEALKGKKAGQMAEFEVERKGKKIKLKGPLQARPLETSDYSELIYDQAAFKNGQVRVIINKPKGLKDKAPALLFIPGYACSSMDNLETEHPYKRIIDVFGRAGFVVLRIEKSGLGDSENTPSCESCDLHDEIENFQAGLDKLKSLSFVDTNKIIIFGHSMGGIIAPALGAKNRVAGLIVYGTTAKSWFEYQLEMYRVQNLLAEMEPLAYEQSIREQYELNYRFFVQNESLLSLAQDPKNDSILRQAWLYDGQGKIFGRNADYWRQIQGINHLENWKNTQAKVLVQYGAADFQAFSQADHEQIVRTVNYYRPNQASLQIFPETDHYFAKSGTMKKAFDAFNEQNYQALFLNYDSAVGHSALAWARGIFEQPKQVKEADFQWEVLNTEPYAGKQDDVYFINEKTGWYINGTGRLYQTQDGGKTWKKLYEKQGSFFRTLVFLDEKRGFLGTVGTDYFPNVLDTIALYQTEDGGQTWSPVDYQGPYVKGLCALDLVRETYINKGQIDYKLHLYGVGRVGSPAFMLYSSDGGQTWTSKSMGQDCAMLFDVKMINKQKGFVCAATDADLSKSNALMLKTEDGGQTWLKVYQSERPFETTWKMSFPSEQIGYATIQSYNPDPNVKQQRIIKTEDGGQTWRELDLVSEHQARPFGIGFIDDKHGFVGTMTSGFETQDGGQTWKPINLGRACNKIRIQRDEAGAVYGYAIGLQVLKLKQAKD